MAALADRRFLVLLLLAGTLLPAAAGCSRAYYRRQADREVYGLTGRAASDPRWQLDDYCINPSPQSRMFDRTNPDFPPMPPDDPASHRLMHCVDCKRGWPCWHRNGDTRWVENPCWMRYLPVDETGAVALDRESAMELALLHSREYQLELEDLYLSALDVTYQRFRFDVQFFGTHKTTYTADGPDRSGGVGTQLEVDHDLEARRLLASGGEVVVGLANSLVWTFSGPDTYTANTLLDFSIVQPLLRGAGRAVILENLTQSERTLLANVRQTERFRQACYAQIINGRALPTGTMRLAPSISPITGNNPGYQIYAYDRDSLELLEATYAANRIDRFQVDLIRQSLYNAQRALLSLLKTHDDRLDAYKITLGLPPQTKVRVVDTLLDRFNMIDPSLTKLADDLGDFIDGVQRVTGPPDPATLAAWLDTVQSLCAEAEGRLKLVERDMQAMRDNLPSRRESLREISSRDEFRRGDVEPSAADVVLLDRRAAALEDDFETAAADFRSTLAEIEQARSRAAAEASENANPRPGALEPLLNLLMRLSNQVQDLSLLDARARLDTVTLVPIQLGSDEALEVARANRLDWMNARAALVDVWRQIQVTANELRGDMSVTFSGDINTDGTSPLRFRSSTGRLRVGLQFDPPLTRLAERNLYREALIEYQQARRAYYAYEDRVAQSLRITLRAIQLDQVNFELQRAAVQLAIAQVEISRLRITRPPKPGEVSQLGATTARDLANALSELLSSQNALLAVFVDYETQRTNLDLDLGTMQLDHRGIWIDPGPVRSGQSPTEGPEEIPAPEALTAERPPA